MAMALVTKQEFSRTEIGMWDNSCRSWIRTANSARAVQLKVALFNTDRAGAKVNVLPNIYHSVIQAWKDAMISINALVKWRSPARHELLAPVPGLVHPQQGTQHHSSKRPAG
jgi:hypothetical protein